MIDLDAVVKHYHGSGVHVHVERRYGHMHQRVHLLNLSRRNLRYLRKRQRSSQRTGDMDAERAYLSYRRVFTAACCFGRECGIPKMRA